MTTESELVDIWQFIDADFRLFLETCKARPRIAAQRIVLPEIGLPPMAEPRRRETKEVSAARISVPECVPRTPRNR